MVIKKQNQSKNSPKINKVKNRKIILSICLIVIIPSISFYPSLKNDFVNFDDIQYVTNNRMIQDFSLENIKLIFGRFYMGHYHPLTLLSYFLEFQFFNLNPFAYHTTNLLLHLLNSLLVFWLILMMGGGTLASLVVALLFSIHPLHVESVAWISERKDVLYSFFFFGSMISYLYYRKNHGMNYYYLSLSLFVLSLLSKSMAVTLPIILLLCDYLLGRKFDKKSFTEKIPFFSIAFFFGIIAIYAKDSPGTTSLKAPVSFIESLFILSQVIVSYFSKLVLPIRLSCLYPSIKEISSSSSYLYLSLVVGLLIGGILSGKLSKKITFGILFFFITISPILPLNIVADRYTYIPFIGIFYIIGEGFSWLYHWKIAAHKIVKTIPLIMFIGIVGIFSFLTWERCRIWKDSVSLWSDVLKNYPNILIAYIDRGTAFLQRREFDRAISDFNHALKMNPDDEKTSSIYNNRGNAYVGKGLYDQAIPDFTKAIALNPRYEVAYSNRGNTYYTKGLYDQALKDFNTALEINPGYVEVHFNKALVLEDMGHMKEAIDAYQYFVLNAPPQYSKHIYHAINKVKKLSRKRSE